VMAGMEAANHPELSRPVIRAAACNANAAGAQGVLFHTYYPQPARYPYDDAATGNLRFMGHPDLLSRLDKTFRVGPALNPNSASTYGLEEQLPAELDIGTAREFSLEVGDDIAARAEAGELWRCELRVFLQHLTCEDEVKLVWNSAEIAPSDWRKADWTYQLRSRPDYAINGYRLHIDLEQLQRLPRKGTNAIALEALKKDQQLIHPVTLVELALVVEYLPHRNALRNDEEFLT